MALYTHNLGDRQQDIDLGNCSILGIACNSTMCGKKWLDGYLDSLDQSDKRKIQQTGSRSIFVFGGGNQLRSGLELTKLELILRLKINTCPQAANHCALFWW